MTRTRILALLFGTIFGFLLQKGGVAKFDVLVGALLLEDFTVFQVILSAIAVGSVGVHSLHRMGIVSLHVQPLRPTANLVGGLVFGVGFGLLGYCPGTEAAAIGQGNLDAITGAVGMLAGSWLFAEVSRLGFPFESSEQARKTTLAEIVRMAPPAFLALFVPLIGTALLLLELAGAP